MRSITPVGNFNEFQRADSAPRSTKGDGVIDATDVVQVRRYITLLDPVQAAGGPGEEIALPAAPLDGEAAMEEPSTNRLVKVSSAMGAPGERVSVAVEINPEGGELAASFTLNYDASKLRNPRVALGSDAIGGLLTTNDAGDGRLGILVETTGAYAGSMTRQMVTIAFDIADSAPGGTTAIAFSDTLAGRAISDTLGNKLAARYQAGEITILGPASSGVEIAGRVTTPEGRGLRNATLTLTAVGGSVRTATTGPFGYYRFENVASGRTYTLAINSRRYRFGSRRVDAVENLSGVDFVAEE